MIPADPTAITAEAARTLRPAHALAKCTGRCGHTTDRCVYRLQCLRYLRPAGAGQVWAIFAGNPTHKGAICSGMIRQLFFCQPTQ